MNEEERATLKNTAEDIYSLYSETVGFKTYNGKPLPKYSELGNQGKGWVAVAAMLIDEVKTQKVACKEQIARL